MNRTFCVGLIVSIAALAQTPVLRPGISVEMAVTSSALPMREADQSGSRIVAVARSGQAYLDATPVTPAALADALRLAANAKVFVKADARASYASVAAVFSVLRAAGAETASLLTSQRDPADGRNAPPRGVEVSFSSPAVSEKAVVLDATGPLQFGDVVRIIEASYAAGAKVYLR